MLAGRGQGVGRGGGLIKHVAEVGESAELDDPYSADALVQDMSDVRISEVIDEMHYDDLLLFAGESPHVLPHKLAIQLRLAILFG